MSAACDSLTFVNKNIIKMIKKRKILILNIVLFVDYLSLIIN